VQTPNDATRRSLKRTAVASVSLIGLPVNNSLNQSTDKSKSQFFALYVFLSSKYRIEV